ncbi:MAG TPA: hypothetical protein VFY43_08595 [Candidatus Limnocylindria bacterium]|nr:hypothetical protein [Candidatus Limnocylindria bacterium]
MTPPEPDDRAVDDEEPIRFAWLARVFGVGMAAYVRLVAATSRFSGGPINQDRVILAIWHESNLVAAVAMWRLRKDRRAVSFSTRGFRGIVMNTMVRSLGAQVVTLPDEDESTRAEATALARDLAALGRAGRTLVVSPDGPFGPHRVAKPGAVIVARESGLAIQPWAIASRPTLHLTGRWDRMLVPLPFGRLRVFEGTTLVIGERDRIKPRLAELQARLDDVQARADADSL